MVVCEEPVVKIRRFPAVAGGGGGVKCAVVRAVCKEATTTPISPRPTRATAAAQASEAANIPLYALGEP